MSRRCAPAMVAFALVTGFGLQACAPARGGETVAARRVTTAPAKNGPTATPTLPPATPASPTPAPRTATDQRWIPFASVGGVTLLHPSARVERVAFHEANHDGARQLDALPSAIAPVTLETRERGTGSRTAADVVADPNVEVRAPVTGTVKRAGSYVLYCDDTDGFVVVEPDDHPGWEVKILHISGVRVAAGNRVVAGQTVLAPHPTRLPFESQVDELSPAGAWPHVHIEVVDPSIPDRPTPGDGCN